MPFAATLQLLPHVATPLLDPRRGAVQVFDPRVGGRWAHQTLSGLHKPHSRSGKPCGPQPAPPPPTVHSPAHRPSHKKPTSPWGSSPHLKNSQDWSKPVFWRLLVVCSDKKLFAKMPGGSSAAGRRRVQPAGFLREGLTRSAISLAAARHTSDLRKNLSGPLKGATGAARDSYCS